MTNHNHNHPHHYHYDYHYSISIGDGDGDGDKNEYPNNNRVILKQIDEITNRAYRFQHHLTDRKTMRLEIKLGANYSSKKQPQSYYCFAIPPEIANAMVHLLSTLKKLKERFTTFVWLEAHPTVSDDDNFRRIIQAATMTDSSSSSSKVYLQDVRICGYGDCYPFGTLGCSYNISSSFPSLWDIIGRSDSLENLEIFFHDGNDDDENEYEEHDFSEITDNYHHDSAHSGGGMVTTAPGIQSYRCWKAIASNESLRSLSVNLYCSNDEHLKSANKDNHHSQSAISHSATTSCVRTASQQMRDLSKSLRQHPTIQRLQIYYRKDAACLESMFVPHVTDLLLGDGGSSNSSGGSGLVEMKVGCFSMALNGRGKVVQRNNGPRRRHQSRRGIRRRGLEESSYDTDGDSFPIREFAKALESAKTRTIEVLRLCNVGLVTWQADELLSNLPSNVKILDLSNNDLDQFPSITRRKTNMGCTCVGNDLVELNLWKNPCLYIQEQIESLHHMYNMLVAFPCLVSFGPWNEWQCYKSQKRLLEYNLHQQQQQQQRSNRRNSRSREDNSDNDSDDNDSTPPLTTSTVTTKNFSGLSSLRELMDRIVSRADQNRYKVRFLSRVGILSECPSLWPKLLSRITTNTQWHEHHHQQQQKQQHGITEFRTVETITNTGFVSTSTSGISASDCRRQANILFYLIRENSSRGIYSRSIE